MGHPALRVRVRLEAAQELRFERVGVPAGNRLRAAARVQSLVNDLGR